MLKYITRIVVAFIVLTGSSAGLLAQWSYNIIPHFRTGNSVFIINNQSAVIAGGNELLDSIQTISRSDDRALNWGINLDLIKPWLKSVYYITDSIGIAVGYDGTIIRCTDGGTNWTRPVPPGNTYQRHFNSVYFANTSVGYIAGGWPGNDSIQTILKTTDGGVTWSVQRDNLGYMLRSIYFTDPQNGLAVGDNGVILKTTDGGSNWNTVTLTGNIATRRFNEVEFITPSTGFIVGGNKSNDSIQTILKTTDGGDNWSVIADNIGPMLNSIDFAGASQAYIVGDKGTLLKTTDTGDSWNALNLPFSINDSTDLLGVNFLNVDFGIAVGKAGKMLVYQNPLPVLPVATTLNASDISANSARLNGLVSATDSAYVVFEYGTTGQLGDSITASPAAVHGVSGLNISKVVTGLLPNTFYYYRIKAGNSAGSNVGLIKQFYTADCEIPNCSFENWDTSYFDVPLQWNRIGASYRVSSYDGSYAVKVIGEGINKIGAVILGNVTNDFPVGGFPLTMQPDSIKCMARYDIAAGDTGYIATIFRKNGQVQSMQTFPITGNSGGNFVEIKRDITFSNSDVPDSVVVGILSSNAFSDSLTNPASYLIVDNIAFTGTPDVIPNGDFELWGNEIFERPNGWSTLENDNASANIDRVVKTTDVAGGNFAIRLQNDASTDRVTYAETGESKSSFNKPTFPIAGKHQTFNGFLKFLPQNDTLNVAVALYKNGIMVGYGGFILDTLVPTYTGFETTILYPNPNDVPDSASISIRLGSQYIYGNSMVYIDLLSFDGFKQTVGLKEADDRDILCTVYPNPANDKLEITFVNNRQAEITYRLTDLQGHVVMQTSGQQPAGVLHQTLDVSSLAPGLYVMTLSNGTGTAQKRLVITPTK